MITSHKIINSKSLPALFAILVLTLPLFMIPFAVLDSAAACISYSSSSKTITINCTTTTHLANVNTALNNPQILKKESTGIWLLAANLVVAKGGNMVIDSSDTTWLKIISNGAVAYGLKNSGTLKIDSVKITSWNTAANTYASPGSAGQTPRAYIVSSGGATGTMNVLNSEVSYLGYKGTGHHGLDYYGGDKSLVQNNQIHHNWRAFYSSSVSGLTFTKNIVHDNYEYGIDPHSGTHDMYITFNKSYNNNHGIICSQDCFNIHIENNELYKNKADGIFLNADSHHSFIKNNNIHDQETAIQLPSISYSEISGNTITNSKYGIKLYTETGSKTINNNIHNNNIKASNTGIEVRDGASTNSITSNTIDGLGTGRGIVVKGSTTSGNVISDNHFSNAKYGISLSAGNINSKFINNHFATVAPSGEYTLESASALKIETTQFSSDVIKSQDSSNSPVSISKSGFISVTDGVTGLIKKYDTNTNAFSKTLTNNAKITITSSSITSSATSLTLKSSGGVDSIQSNFTSTISSNHSEANPRSMKTSNTDDTNVSIGNDSGKDPSNSSNVNIEDQQRLIEKISPQKYPDEEAKLAQQLAQQHLMNQNNIENKLVKTEQPSYDKKEKDKTIDSTAPNESTNDVTRDSLGGTGSENRQITPDRTSKLPSQFEAVPPQHHTLLSLRLIPSKTEGTYKLTGMLWDKTAGKPLSWREIFLSADPPIKIPSQFTNKAGHFDINNVNVPTMSNSYKIQAHFAKDSHYDGADSQVIVLKANRHKAAAELPLPEHTTSQVDNAHPVRVHKSNEQWNSTFGAID